MDFFGGRYVLALSMVVGICNDDEHVGTHLML